MMIGENEGGRWIMGGKVKGSESEGLRMIGGEMMGNDGRMGFGGREGKLEVKVFKAVMMYKFLE
ncbi:hypothetical protein [Bacillus altitudinis]|uniref:hypothetical protein n=1 Tax=Bacillus altitudinis TaxID=293387 RepID=UPI00307FCE6A